MRAFLVLGAVLLLALPARARSDDFTTVVKEALASAEPTTAVLRGLATLPDFDMNGDAVAAALTAAGAKPDGQVAKVLGDVTRLRKKKDRITIERRNARTLPIVVLGETKGWVRLEEKLEFRIRSNEGAVTLDKFDGISVGETEKKLYSLRSIGWKPGTPDSLLTIIAGWGIFSETNEFKVPNVVAPPASASADTGLPPPPPVKKHSPRSERADDSTSKAPAPHAAGTPGILAKVGASAP